MAANFSVREAFVIVSGPRRAHHHSCENGLGGQTVQGEPLITLVGSARRRRPLSRQSQRILPSPFCTSPGVFPSCGNQIRVHSCHSWLTSIRKIPKSAQAENSKLKKIK